MQWLTFAAGTDTILRRFGRNCRIEEYAGMVELADAQDLGSCAARRVGSTPTTRIREKARWVLRIHRAFFYIINSVVRGLLPRTKRKTSTQCVLVFGAREGTRTPKDKPHAPQTCASASSATLAYHIVFAALKSLRWKTVMRTAWIYYHVPGR